MIFKQRYLLLTKEKDFILIEIKSWLRYLPCTGAWKRYPSNVMADYLGLFHLWERIFRWRVWLTRRDKIGRHLTRGILLLPPAQVILTKGRGDLEIQGWKKGDDGISGMLRMRFEAGGDFRRKRDTVEWQRQFARFAFHSTFLANGGVRLRGCNCVSQSAIFGYGISNHPSRSSLLVFYCSSFRSLFTSVIFVACRMSYN